MRPLSMRGIVLSVVAALLWPAGAGAQQPYYQGKELRILVGYASGGGYDSYARIVGRFIAAHLPGAPIVVVQNMPGADGLAVANHMAQRAPRDGTVIALTNRNLSVAPLLGMIEKASVQYDPAAFFWIANLNVDLTVLAVRKETGLQKVEDLMKRELVVGATGLTAPNAIYPHVLNNLLGTRIKVVAGYPGTSNLVLAMERGEIGGNAGWTWSSLKVQRPHWIASGEIRVLMQLGSDSEAELKGIPLIFDFVKTEREKRALELVFAADALGRPFFAPPGTPPEVGRLLRTSFEALAKDKAFLEAASKAKLDITFQDGQTVEGKVKRLLDTPAETVALARQLMQPAKTVIEHLPKKN